MRPLETLRRKPALGLAAAALLGAVLAALAARAWPTRYETTLDFVIDRPAPQETADYAYDGYYALRASELFADTLIGWFSTPSFVKSVLTRAESAPPADAALPARLFRAKRYSSQLVVVRFSAKAPEAAAALAAAAAAEASDRTSRLIPDAKSRSLFTLRAAPPVTEPRRLSSGRAAFAGAALGALCALAYLYFAPRKEKAPEA